MEVGVEWDPYTICGVDQRCAPSDAEVKERRGGVLRTGVEVVLGLDPDLAMVRMDR